MSTAPTGSDNTSVATLALRQAEVSPLPPLEYIRSAAPCLRTVNTQNNGLLSFCANGSSVLAEHLLTSIVN